MTKYDGPSNGFKCPMCGGICMDLGNNHYLCPNKCDAEAILNAALPVRMRGV